MLVGQLQSGSCGRKLADTGAPTRRFAGICCAEPIRASIRGGARVTLSGSGGGCQLVLVDEEAQLPFAASLEYVCPHSSSDKQQQQHPPLSAATDIIELTYVLSGSGHLREAGSNMAWPLQPGTSMITWANSTYLEPESQQGPQQAQQQEPNEPLAVLKFHLPISVLDPTQPATTLSRVQRAALAEAQGQSWPASTGQAATAQTESTLDDAAAVRLLQAARAGTRRALQHAPSTSYSTLPRMHTAPTAAAAGNSPIGVLNGERPGVPSALSTLAARVAALQRGQEDVTATFSFARGMGESSSRMHSGVGNAPGGVAALGVLAAGVAALQQGGGGASAALWGLLAGPLAQLPLHGLLAGPMAQLPLTSPWTSLGHLRPASSDVAHLARAAAHTAAHLAAPLLARGLPPLHNLLPQSLHWKGSAADARNHSRSPDLPHKTHQTAIPLGSQPLRPDGTLMSVPRITPGKTTPGTVFGSQLPRSQCVLMARTMEDFKAFRFPAQTNQLAFVFDPLELGLSLSFGVEIFEPGHKTPLHVHRTGHELFFVLSGDGDAFCDGQHIPLRAGDCIVFPPGSLHGLDNNTSRKLYALQMMCPDDEFVAFVQSGESVGRLNDEDICNLTASRC